MSAIKPAQYPALRNGYPSVHYLDQGRMIKRLDEIMMLVLDKQIVEERTAINIIAR